jgi:hypothetical protein
MNLFNPFLIPIVAIGGYFLHQIICSIAESYTATSKHRADTELKMQLVQRGMSASEIERVLTATAGGKTTAPEEDFGAPMPPHKRPTSPLNETQPYRSEATPFASKS